MLTIVVISVVIYILYKYYRWATYWKRNNVPSTLPLPVFGSIAPTIFGKRSMAHILEDYYRTYSHKRYVGFYNGLQPALFLRDPELIKKITIKEFDSFPQHPSIVPRGMDDVWDKSILAMPGGKRWQDVRSTLSPAFTTSKMKMMFELMKKCAKNVSTYYLKKKKTITLDIGDTFKRYASDVIVTSALGVTTNSLENRDDDFYRHGLEIVNNGATKGTIFFLVNIIPSVLKALGVKVFHDSTKRFFTDVIQESIKLRKEKSIYRPDTLQLMLEAQQDKLSDDTSDVSETNNRNKYQNDLSYRIIKKTALTDEDIHAQAMLFYLGGFDTSSMTMSQAAYELAINPDIQTKLRQEIDETLANSENGDFTYENLMGMKYLDGVVSETLRKWPPFPFADRIAVKSFTIEPEIEGESILQLRPGDQCIFPIYAIQRDPNYFPNPDKFDPERFSDENKHDIKPFTYLPFGAGPRVCIAARFALLETKLILAELISKFEIIPVEQTIIPMKISKRNFNPVPDEGFWLGLVRRNI